MPVIISMYIPNGVFVLAVTMSLAVDPLVLGVTADGLNDAVTPGGNAPDAPLTVR